MAAREADRVVVIGPPAARNSYLNPRLIVHAATATGCDGLHPGYGFLSERQSLAALCDEAGVVFVGPTARLYRGGGRQTLGPPPRKGGRHRDDAGQREARHRRRGGRVRRRDWVSGRNQSVRWRRRARHGRRSRRESAGGRVRARLDRGQGSFRGRHALYRALRRASSARRSAGPRSWRRASVALWRARLLAATPVSEDG